MITGAINGHSGYATHARDLIKELSQYIDVESKGFHIQVGLPNMFESWKSPFKLAFVQYEATHIPSTWVKRLNEADLIIPGSEFAKQVFIDSGVTTEIKVVEWPLNKECWNDYGTLYVSPYQKEAFTFLSFGTMIPRKNYQDLIMAYSHEFQEELIDIEGNVPENPTLLMIKSDSLQEVMRIKQGLSVERSPLIAFCYSHLSLRQLNGLYKGSDCLVQCSHGESVGGPVLEAQAQGTPVVYTNWSGVTEYAYQGTPVDICGLEPVFGMDHIGPYENCEWARLDIQSLMKAMRKEYNEKRRIVWERPNYNTVKELATILREHSEK